MNINAKNAAKLLRRFCKTLRIKLNVNIAAAAVWKNYSLCFLPAALQKKAVPATAVHPAVPALAELALINEYFSNQQSHRHRRYYGRQGSYSSDR